MGHQFKHCPFVDDRLIQLLKNEVMNVHQLIIPITTIISPNALMQRIQIMNPSFGHETILVSYQLASKSLVTPFVPSRTNVLPTFTYPMWYNVIPLYILLDNVYPTYPTITKWFDPLIYRNHTCYVLGYVYLVPKQLVITLIQTLCTIGNQYTIVV